MRIGIFGSRSLVAHCESASNWANVQWGSDDSHSVIAKLRSGKSIDALVVEGSLEFLNKDVLAAARDCEIPVWALSEGSRTTEWIEGFAGVRRIVELDDIRPAASDFVEQTLRHDERDVQREHVVSDESAVSRVIAVWGVVGAPGASTTAISLAALAAQRGLSVVLCDADTRGSSLAIGLGLVDEVPGFAAACRLAGRGELTAVEIERLVERVSKGSVAFDLLSGLPRASRWAEIAPAKSQAVISLVREMYDLVVIDVGFGIEENEWIDAAPQRDGAAMAIIHGADIVVAVGACDAVGIARFIRGLDELASICSNPVVVLNRATRLSGKEARDALERFTSHRVATTILRDGRGGLDDAMSRAASSFGPLWSAIESRVEPPKKMSNPTQPSRTRWR